MQISYGYAHRDYNTSFGCSKCVEGKQTVRALISAGYKPREAIKTVNEYVPKDGKFVETFCFPGPTMKILYHDKLICGFDEIKTKFLGKSK